MRMNWFLLKVLAVVTFSGLCGIESAIAEGSACQKLQEGTDDGPVVVNIWSQQIATYFNAGDANWNSLAQLIKQWNSPACQFNDGRPRMSVLLPGYSQAFRIEKDWSESLQRVEALKKKYPDSAFALLAEAEYWSDFAWDARGGGYASSVTPDGFKLFKGRMEKAEKVLNEIKPIASILPNWYELMIEVQSTLDRPAAERDKTFIEGATRFKTYYPIYFLMENFLEPKWGGSWEAIDNFVTWSVNNTKATEGQTMYARLYWLLAQGVTRDDNIFTITQAKWPQMKVGFDDLMSRHPQSKWNLNNFASFACLAGDRQTFLALRKRIALDVIDAAWPANHSLDLCDLKYGYKK